MQLVEHVRQMAEYNHWMNQKLYEACGKLSDVQLSENRGAFFGSVLGTLNHLVVGDTIWLKRFASAKISALDVMSEIPNPEALNSILFDSLPSLQVRREQLDQVLIAFSCQVTEAALQDTITYKSFKGVASSKVFFSLLMHLFNHQTHHRGQVSTLLSQLGIDVGVTDLVSIIPNV
jgi:uncharacterized damage-inducible protein DinB